ncbi:MAG: glycerophosphodiester phosphodiesterase [Myxococcota bacterium]
MTVRADPSAWRRRRARPWVIGHRGASAEVTENTTDAFDAAVRAGADGIEFDVQLCRDGELVVFHDRDLSRLVGRGEAIADLSLAAVRAIRLDQGRRIPTLDQVFEHFAASDALLNVEIKSGGLRRAGRSADAVLACLARHRPTLLPRVLISSFDPLAVLRVRRTAGHVLTGQLFHSKQLRPFRRAWAVRLLRPSAVHPSQGLVTSSTFADWKRRGLLVNTWTVDRPARQRALAALGVDALITNDPAACLATLSAPDRAHASDSDNDNMDDGSGTGRRSISPGSNLVKPPA